MYMGKILSELLSGVQKIERVDEKTFIVTVEGLYGESCTIRWEYVTMADGSTHGHWNQVAEQVT